MTERRVHLVIDGKQIAHAVSRSAGQTRKAETRGEFVRRLLREIKKGRRR